MYVYIDPQNGRDSLLCTDYAYRCRQIDSLQCAQLHGDKYFTLARAAYI